MQPGPDKVIACPKCNGLACMLRLPLDALLFIPVLILVALFRLIWLAGGDIPWTGQILILRVALLPRACYALEALLAGQCCTVRAVAGASAALGLSGIFSTFWTITLLEVLGLAAWPPPAPTLGGLFTDARCIPTSRRLSKRSSHHYPEAVRGEVQVVAPGEFFRAWQRP